MHRFRHLLASVTVAAVLVSAAACDRGGDPSDLQIFPEAAVLSGDSALAFDGPPPEFSDVQVEPATDLRPAPVDFDSHPRAGEFRTRLSRGAEEGPNFAGHYTVVTWGCGTMCEEFMIVDARTGEVFDGRTTAVGVEYRLDSRLLLVNPPAAAAAARCTLAACAPQYLVWDGNRLEAVLPEEEREAIRRAAADYVLRETAVGEVAVEIVTVVGQWARLRVIPLAEETDPAVMFLHREGGAWRVIALGTAFAPDDLDRMGVPPLARPSP